MSDGEILRLSALEQAALVRHGDVSPVELAELYLRRIDAHDAELHAFVDVRHEHVLREARARERELPRRDAPPFFGVPIAVKDMNLAAGYFTRMGSRAFERLFLVTDDPTVARLRRAGFVILGKTSVPELSSLPYCESVLAPPTRNPWDLTRTPGGSSGGAGAALAAGLAPIAQGADGGGSIRIPSSLCSLYGLKPSRGRVPNLYGLDDRDVLYTDGPMGRTVDDVASLLDVMAGLNESRPHWAPTPAGQFAALARHDPPPLRIAFATRSPLAETHPDVERAVLRAAKILEEHGHHVEEGAWPEVDDDDFLVLWKDTLAALEPPSPELLEPVNAYLITEGKALTPDRVARARSRLLAAIAAATGTVDVWLTPTVPEPPNLVGAWDGLDVAEMFAAARRVACFVAGFNVSGQPAASVPMGLSSAGHPIGVQVVAPLYREDRVLQVSRQILEGMPPRAAFPGAFAR